MNKSSQGRGGSLRLFILLLLLSLYLFYLKFWSL